MSKRPKKADPAMSRLHRPMRRLRDMPIWSKLGLIMIVPTIATVVVGTNGVIDHLQTADNASRARTLATLAEASGELVDGLQNERSAAVLLLGIDQSDAKQKQKYRDAYTSVHRSVDDATRPYSQNRAELDGLPGNVTTLLREIDEKLADLPATRSQVFNGKLLLSNTIRKYDDLVGQLLDVRDSAVQLANDFGLSQRMRAAAAVARSKEFLSQKRIVVHRALIQDALTPTLRTDFIASEQGQAQALQSFNAVALSSEVELHSQTVAGSDLRSAERYSDWVRTRPVESMQFAPFTADGWDAALVSNAKLIRTVESRLDSGVVDRATGLRDAVQRQLLIETGLLLGMLLLAILFAWLVARSMARSLRELRHGALSIAQYGLPQAVARLRDPQLSAQLSPVQLANQIAEPLPVRSKDEFGQVTEAFNAVHLEAVRTAAEQAALRSSVATMFINLARRSQILVDRLIGHLDRIERGEEDPDRLAELFQLDHLATRMRRNDENLLVLAGADSTRVQRQPAALMDVLRAAQSEVEHYTRIDFGVIDRDIEIGAHAVNDMVHLVAELLDNATAFSPPDSQVIVEARRVGERAVLYVEDRGIGITADQLYELNERLATPPTVDAAISRMMGLVVVARLAARHGVKVELRRASDRGTVADVTIPTSVLVPRALSGRVQQPNAFEATAQQSTASARPQFGPPLALEGGQAGHRPAERDSLGGRPFDPAPLNGGGRLSPAAPVGSLPDWSDLTGATVGRNRTDPFTPRPSNGGDVDPLPQRRATEHWTVDGEVAAGGPVPNIPRQVPSSPEAQPYGLRPPAWTPPVVSVPPHPASAPPVVSAPPGSVPPSPTQARPVPPAWPPVATAGSEAASPPVPEKLAAALDLTTELPTVAQSVAGVPAPRAPERDPRFADETMELPIFRELESAWFKTRRPVPEEAAAVTAARAGAAPGSFSTAVAGRGVSAAAGSDLSPSEPFGREGTMSTGTTGGTAMANTPMSADRSYEAGPGAATGGAAGNGGGAAGWGDGPTGRWHTAADDGWRAASAASQVPVVETTQTGLPKRVPMAQLVPGGVDKPTNSVQRRTPEAVRGLLSAYHRGVQRGRGKKDENPGAAPTGQPPQSGFGLTAGRGQKEHER